MMKYSKWQKTREQGSEISSVPVAVKQLNTAIDFIRKDSIQNSDAVKEQILLAISKLSDPTFSHRTDPFKKNNDGHFHFFESLNYRISYYINWDEGIIVRIRHARMMGLHY